MHPARQFHPVTPLDPPRPVAPKLRPASHSYLVTREPLVAVTITLLCGGLIYVGAWMIRLLG